MKIIRDIEQGSEAWFQLRAGSVGASSLDKILTSVGKRSTQRKKYMYQLAGEKITGQKAETYINAAMEEGIRREAESRELFELIHDVEVEQVALIVPDNESGWHVSPDGILKNQEVGFEVKNPNMATHVEYLLKGVLPTKYRLQVQMSMYVSEFKHWYFMSHFAGLKPLIIKVPKDEELIKIIEKELKLFVSELNEIIQQIQ